MTVIATFAIGGFPLVFGDLLLTGPTEERRRVAVPSQGEVQEFFGDSGWSISGLRQKLAVISDSCVVAWSGSWLGAKIAITELRRLALEGSLSLEEVFSCLSNEPELKAHPASFVGLLCEAGNLRQFHVDAEQFASASLGTTFFSGSGGFAIKEFSDTVASMDLAVSGAANAAHRAIAMAMSLGGLLLQSEFRGGDAATTLRNMFGGGYEIAFYSNGRMQKLKEVTYVIWEAVVDDAQTRVSHPQFLMKQTYSGDHLLIRSLRVETDPTPGILRVSDEQAHVIAPMYETSATPDPSELRAVSMQSRLLCHCILVRGPNEVIGVYTRVQQYSADSELTVTFEDQDGQIVFGIRNDTANEIGKAVQKFRQDRNPAN